jgi:CubicO group peptidase (beta-lactamase class C family)
MIHHRTMTYFRRNISMKMFINTFILTLLFSGIIHGQEIKLPDTPQGKAVQSFLEAFNSGNNENLLKFFKSNVSNEGLSLRSAEARVEKMSMFRKEVLSLKAQKIISTSETELRLNAKAGNGEDFTLGFQFEQKVPHKFAGLQVEMGQSVPEEIGPPMMIDELVPALEKYLTSQTEADKFSGAVLVARDTSILFMKSYGYSDKRLSTPNRTDTKFNLGSINKMFTRIAIAQLAEKGKLSLDDFIIKHIPDYPNKSVAKKVKISHLLDMTSGLGDFFGEKYENTPKNKIRKLSDYFELFKDNKLQFEPGSQEQYSNAGYIVLGLIIERISGVDYYTYVSDNIFKPAGMLNTDSYEMDTIIPNLATGYTHPEGDEKTWISNIYSAPGRGSSAGGGYSTVEDLYNFIHALKNGKLLSPKYTAWILMHDFTKDVPTLPIKEGYIAIAGGAPGINAGVDYEAKTGNIVIVLGNLDPPAAMDVSKKIRGYMRRFVRGKN